MQPASSTRISRCAISCHWRPYRAFLKAAAIDLAVYRIANTADRLTNEMRQRYEDHIRHLERIADGKAGLGFEDSASGDGEDTPDATASGRAYSFKSVRA